ncbi:AAA family ATPase [Aeromonas sanarellii]|uniref:AAA family ATPase n=1 Tax=Aeromonas sanarellii TaxID=633415 RepID=UPI0038D0677A
MIKDFKLENYGPIVKADGNNLGKINLVLGKNSTGKTFFLKALYSAIRSHEEANKGQSNLDFSEVLSDKLYWTFQMEKIGDIVTKGDGKRLSASITLNDNSSLVFGFGKDTTKKITPNHNNLTKSQSNSIFLPPKEVLSLIDVIHKSAVIDKLFGFDATYVDLISALKIPTQKGRNNDAFASSRKRLENMFSGKVEFDTKTSSWIYKKGNSKYSIMSTAEGVKKIAILDTLLGNRYLDKNSIIFIDEPESALHPTAIVDLLEIIAVLANSGIQFFLATHSYYVIKKLLLIAKNEKMPIPTFMADDTGEWQQTCLLEDGLPDNEIINESVRLFEAEFTGSLR